MNDLAIYLSVSACEREHRRFLRCRIRASNSDNMGNPFRNAKGNTASTPSFSSQEPSVPGNSPSESSTISLREKTLPDVHGGCVESISQDRDTHIPPDSSVASPRQRSRKLSPTASPFQPIFGTSLRALRVASWDLSAPTVLPPFPCAPHNLSSRLGLSRHLLFTPTSGKLSVADIQGFLKVRSHVAWNNA